MTLSLRRFARALLALGLVLQVGLLDACQYADPNTTYPEKKRGGARINQAQRETIFGGGGLGANLFGTGEEQQVGVGAGIGVNFFLWRASLDTVSFMPLASADPFGGVIITDWYSAPEAPDERFKLTVYVLSRALRADGVKVAVFRQRRDAAGGWIDEAVEPTAPVDLENAILTRARQMRIASVGS